MNDPSSLPGELPELLAALLDGSMTAAKQERLGEILRRDARARAYYLEYVYTHALLRWELGEPLPLPQPEAGARRAAARKTRPAAPARHLLVAAVLLVAVGLGAAGVGGVVYLLRGTPPAPPAPVAVLGESRDAVWETNTRLPTAAGASLPPGRLKLKAGVAELRFHSGAVVRLEGPAEFALETADRGELARGRLTATVPEKARGFTVNAPGAVVRDLGTEFGMRVDETGGTEVQVFEGQVEASLRGADGQPAPPVQLVQGDARRLDPPARTIEKVPFDEKPFARLRPERPVEKAATPVDLSAKFSRAGIARDGIPYIGGLDGKGHVYSADLLGDSLVADGYRFNFGTTGPNHAVGARGQSLELPAGRFSALALLATAVNGDRPDQPFAVTYTDGTKEKFTQSLSDWLTPRDFAGESVAKTMAYRNTVKGTRDNQTCALYLYRFRLDRGKTVGKLTLPNDPGVAILAIDLIP